MHILRSFAAILTLTATAVPLQSASLLVLLRHVRVIDGNGGTPLEDATIVLAGAMIQSIHAHDTRPAPPNVRVIDLSGKTVMPGLISDHSHLGQVENGKSGAGLYTRDNVLHQLAQWQAYGVTTVTSLGLNPPLFYELRSQLNRGSAKLPGPEISGSENSDSAIAGPEIFGADRGIGIPSGAPPIPPEPGDPYRPATAEEARADVREMAARHTDLIKIWVDDYHGRFPVKMSTAVYSAIIDEAHKQHLRVAAHIFYLADAKQLVRAGVDILAHGVRDQAVDDEFISLMKQHGTWYIATLNLDETFYLWAQHPPLMDTLFFQRALSPGLREHLSDPVWQQKINDNTTLIETSKQALKHNQENLKRLYDADVSIGFGTDSGANPERIPGFAEHRELHLTVDAGLTPLQAITLATKNAAALLRLTDRGMLAPGKRASFVVLDANPGADIDNTQKIAAVWHNGQQVSGVLANFTPK